MTKKRKPSVGEQIIEGMREALAHARGEENGCRVHRFPRDYRPPHGASIHYLRSDQRSDRRDYETR